MGFLVKLAAKFFLNGVALYLAALYFPNFVITGGLISFITGAAVLTVLNAFLRPVLKLVATPLIWLSFGLFNFIINMFVLWLADQLLIELAINDLSTLFWVSIIIALANAFI